MSPLFAGDVLEPLQGAQGVLGPHLRTTDQICSGFPQRTNTNDQTSEKLILWHSIGSWCNFHIASSHQKPTLKLAPSHCQICLGMCQIFLVQVSDHYCSRKCTAGTQMLGSLMVLKLLSLSWKFLLKFTLITNYIPFFFFEVCCSWQSCRLSLWQSFHPTHSFHLDAASNLQCHEVVCITLWPDDASSCIHLAPCPLKMCSLQRGS